MTTNNRGMKGQELLKRIRDLNGCCTEDIIRASGYGNNYDENGNEYVDITGFNKALREALS